VWGGQDPDSSSSVAWSPAARSLTADGSLLSAFHAWLTLEASPRGKEPRPGFDFAGSCGRTNQPAMGDVGSEAVAAGVRGYNEVAVAGEVHGPGRGEHVGPHEDSAQRPHPAGRTE
jgi:hypothetical protein